MNAPVIDIRPIDILDPGAQEEAEEWAEVHAAVQRERFGDKGSAFSLAELQAFHGSPQRRRVNVAAYLDDELVGAVEVSMPTRDNLEFAFLWLSVLPRARRRGVGTALLVEAERIAAENGRVVLLVESEWAQDGEDLSEPFATRHGYTVGQTMLRSEMSLEGDDRPLADIVDRPGAEDYAFESYLDHMPPEWLEQRAMLQQRMSTDAPVDDLALEEEAWDVERMRESLERVRESGRRIVETAVRHLPSGRLVGFTQITVSASDPELGYQQDTLVLSEHRGHALGLRLKAANALVIRKALPAVTSVRTWNSATNEHMLAVNRALGYVHDGYSREWQKVVR